MRNPKHLGAFVLQSHHKFSKSLHYALFCGYIAEMLMFILSLSVHVHRGNVSNAFSLRIRSEIADNLMARSAIASPITMLMFHLMSPSVYFM